MPIEVLESRAAGPNCKPLPLRHVVESQQFTVPLLMELFDRAIADRAHAKELVF